MTTTHTCPECGKPVATSGLGGLCPECMMKVGLAPQTGEAGPGGTRVVTPKPTPPSLAEIARLFPQLEILGALGCGGMGAVYKARQPRLDRLVALKVLIRSPEDDLSDARFAERFEREARALARLSHPNIVSMYEFGQVENLPYFIMEFVDGLNLRQLEQAGQLTQEEALHIIPQICEALQFAHDEGVVHRDIKPENILLDKKGRVKIADFGIAKILNREAASPTLTKDQQVIGTPHYMAPEQVERPKVVDHRADIYSLGVVFYEMLTGELPLGKFAPPSKSVQVDVRLDEVVLHALEKQPERRYQQASQVKTDVELIASSERPNTPQPAPAAAANPWQPAILLVGALIGSALLLVGTALERPANWLAFLFGSFTLVVSVGKLAGLWPFPSGLFPASDFTRRNALKGREVLIAALIFGTCLAIAAGVAFLTRARTRAEQPRAAYGVGIGGLPNGNPSNRPMFTQKVSSIVNTSATSNESNRPVFSQKVSSVTNRALVDAQAPQQETAQLRVQQTEQESERMKKLYAQKLVSTWEYALARLAASLAVQEQRADTNAVLMTRMELARIEFRWKSELYDKKLISEADFQKARTGMDLAAAEFRRDVAALAQLRASPQADDSAAFGPVINQVIRHQGTNAFFDLDSGRFIQYTGPKTEAGELREGQIDLYFSPTLKELDTLAALGMQCVEIAIGQAAFDHPPSVATLRTIIDERASRGGTPILSPSTIHAFRTHEGKVGIIQLLGPTDGWSGVSFRYRLANY